MHATARSCVYLLLFSAFRLASAGQTYFGGTVVDSTDQPIAGVTVQAGHAALGSGPLAVDGQATTDAQGHYAITTLGSGDGSGNYVVLAREPGRVTIAYPDSPCVQEQGCSVGEAPPPIAAPNAGVNFKLPLAASIAGHVGRADTGRDIPERLVTLRRQNNYYLQTTTDAAGNYNFSGLPADSYQVVVDFSQAADQLALLPQVYAGHDYDVMDQQTTPDNVTLAEGNAATGIDFVLHTGSAFSGTISSVINGQPLATDVAVRRLTPVAANFFWSFGGSLGHVISPSNPLPSGQYLIQPLLPGTFHVAFGMGTTTFTPQYYADANTEVAAQTVTLTGPTIVGGIDGHLTPRQTITGHITDASTGAPIPNVIVRAGPAIGPFGLLQSGVPALTDASGFYLLQGLDPGTVYVWVSDVPGYRDQIYPNVFGCCFIGPGVQAVQLNADQQVANIDMGLSLGAYVSGRVYDPDTGAPFAADSPVYLVGAIDRQLFLSRTDDTGRFTTPRAPTGTYQLSVNIRGGILYYPDYFCADGGQTCGPGQIPQLDLSATQQYIIDFPIPHLDLIMRNGFEP